MSNGFKLFILIIFVLSNMVLFLPLDSVDAVQKDKMLSGIAKKTSYEAIYFAQNRNYFFLRYCWKYNFPCFKAKKLFFVLCHHPMNKGCSTSGIPNNENRFFEFDFSPFREEYVIQKKAQVIEYLYHRIYYKECDQKNNSFCIKRGRKLFPFKKRKINCTKKSMKIKIHCVITF